jgi:cytochrome c6
VRLRVPLSTPGAVAMGVAVAGIVSGCGGEPIPTDPATVRAGARLFREAGCQTCHTLAAARSGSRIGPNLDRRRPTADAVARQVRRGGRKMPAFDDRLTEQQIRAVAAYVAEATRR